MILPERVFGMSWAIHTFFGRAIDPISLAIACKTFCTFSSLGSNLGLSETYISTI
jgi:hypothetical protein